MKRALLSVEWLEQERLERNWTQEYVAERLGVEVSTIRRWEYGLHRPQARLYRQLCKLFDKTLDQPAETPAALPVAQVRRTAAARSVEGGQTLQQMPIDESMDAYARFQASDLTMRLFRLVGTWSLHHRNARYQELQTCVMRELEPKDNAMQESLINRRNALRRLAALPIEVWGFSLFGPAVVRPYPIEDMLTQCAAGVTACWHLRMGKDLVFVNDAISRYIPTLKEIVTRSTGKQRTGAADVLAQSLILKGILVRHLQANHEASQCYMQQAETYSKLAGNIALTIAAVRGQACNYDYMDDREQAMHTAEKAKFLAETAEAEGTPIPPMLQSFVYSGLATYQAHTGPRYKQDALRSLGLAQTTFDTAINEHEIAPIWTEQDEDNLLLMAGRAYYYLGVWQQAIETFARIDSLTVARETNRTTSFLDRVMAEVNREDQSRDMEFCIERWKQGMRGAIALRSERSYNEAKVAYVAMRGAWPGEVRIKTLLDDFPHW
ncbi:MAG TPA: helix-turn-helix transcriptional regulator [Ktedonobacteraceae bacterium]|nr:helix-turn-helix transcriptional regulator [Ktedonobacteraceae bacterium]